MAGKNVPKMKSVRAMLKALDKKAASGEISPSEESFQRAILEQQRRDILAARFGG